jgi:hypothetical protein
VASEPWNRQKNPEGACKCFQGFVAQDAPTKQAFGAAFWVACALGGLVAQAAIAKRAFGAAVLVAYAFSGLVALAALTKLALGGRCLQ